MHMTQLAAPSPLVHSVGLGGAERRPSDMRPAGSGPMPGRAFAQAAEAGHGSASLAVERTREGSSEYSRARRAQRLITSRLWPGLDELLGDDDQEDE